eukprot:3152310-Pleurochrysis_carterae.AAC.1
MLCAVAHAAVDWSRLTLGRFQDVDTYRPALSSQCCHSTQAFLRIDHCQGGIWSYVNLHIIIKLILGGAVGMLALIRLQATPALFGAVAPGRPETSLYASSEIKIYSNGSQIRFTIYNILTS